MNKFNMLSVQLAGRVLRQSSEMKRDFQIYAVKIEQSAHFELLQLIEITLMSVKKDWKLECRPGGVHSKRKTSHQNRRIA